MADVTIYKPAGVTVDVIDGDPPPDQSVLVAQLQSENAAFRVFRDGVVARANARKAADVSSVDGQEDLDAAAGTPS